MRTLIARILAGERELFHELVRPYEKSVYVAAFSILQNEQDAEDAAQETVLKALKNLGSFRAESKFSTWLVSIAINEARARLRHARVLKFESVDESPPNEDGGFMPAVISDWREVPLQALERKELRELLQKAIASLPEIYREVLLLRDVEEFSIAETAAALSVSEGVVKDPAAAGAIDDAEDSGAAIGVEKRRVASDCSEAGQVDHGSELQACVGSNLRLHRGRRCARVA